mmetsp:Transcript_39629/g.110193  ORF Transcript_39629/g.110193 Transcript_39629/m.110193 type:complete len:233 (-) Transcript_39629:644-1342(-)
MAPLVQGPSLPFLHLFLLELWQGGLVVRDVAIRETVDEDAVSDLTVPVLRRGEVFVAFGSERLLCSRQPRPAPRASGIQSASILGDLQVRGVALLRRSHRLATGPRRGRDGLRPPELVVVAAIRSPHGPWCTPAEVGGHRVVQEEVIEEHTARCLLARQIRLDSPLAAPAIIAIAHGCRPVIHGVLRAAICANIPAPFHVLRSVKAMALPRVALARLAARRRRGTQVAHPDL